MGARQYRETVLKKLFALSRNSCAFPMCEERLCRPEWPKVHAEICHIAGLNEGSARYDPTMTPSCRNEYPNLILLCPNHHDLIDELEPHRFSVDDLSDMKYAHETWRPGDQEWCSEQQAAEFVTKLVVTHGIVLLGPGEQPRRPIRSGTPMPESVLPEERRQRRWEDRQPPRPNWARSSDSGPDWPRGPRRVRDLANELGLTQREALELCDTLGIPARSKDTRLSEPYADMVRRRVRRDGRARATVPRSA